jgi:hypothetical protein
MSKKKLENVTEHLFRKCQGSGWAAMATTHTVMRNNSTGTERLLRALEVSGSNIGPETGYFD